MPLVTLDVYCFISYQRAKGTVRTFFSFIEHTFKVLLMNMCGITLLPYTPKCELTLSQKLSCAVYLICTVLRIRGT